MSGWLPVSCAISALVAPVLVTALGLRPVLILVGVMLPALAIALMPRFRIIDKQSEPRPELLSLFSNIDLLAPLPPTTLEKLAARCSTAEMPTGCVIVTEGDEGKLFYAIVEGHVEVRRGGVTQRTLGAGEHFGEIALVRNITRTATVVAVSDVRVATLGTRDFLDALSSSDAAYGIAWRATEEVMTDHDAKP